MGCPQELDYNRLCGAADFLLKAIEAHAGRNTVITVRVGRRGVEPPFTDSGYTVDELVDAMEMLARLGLVHMERHTG